MDPRNYRLLSIASVVGKNAHFTFKTNNGKFLLKEKPYYPESKEICRELQSHPQGSPTGQRWPPTRQPRGTALSGLPTEGSPPQQKPHSPSLGPGSQRTSQGTNAGGSRPDMKGRRLSFTQINSQRTLQREANPIRQSHKLGSQETGPGSQALSLKHLPGSCPWGSPVIFPVPQLELGLQPPYHGHRGLCEVMGDRRSWRGLRGGARG